MGTPAAKERFRPIRQIGVGGMGVVLEAFDVEHNMRVALKTVRSMSPEALALFKREFRAVQDVNHPNLVIVAEGGRAVLLDFGLVAELALDTGTNEARIVGTPSICTKGDRPTRSRAPTPRGLARPR